VLPLVPSYLHAVATTPAGSEEVVRSYPSPSLAFPSLRRVGTCIMVFEACSAFTHVTACMLAESPARFFYTGGFSGFVTSTTAPIATGWNEPVRGWELHPLWTKRLSRRTRTIPLIARRFLNSGLNPPQDHRWHWTPNSDSKLAPGRPPLFGGHYQNCSYLSSRPAGSASQRGNNHI
jgi:hypothetical protein